MVQSIVIVGSCCLLANFQFIAYSCHVQLFLCTGYFAFEVMRLPLDVRVLFDWFHVILLSMVDH